MKASLTAFCMAGLLFAAPALADEEYDKCMEDSDGTNTAWGECGGEWIRRADTALNATWTELRAVVSQETAKALLDEQRLWNAYKEKSCLFWTSGEYGREGQVISYPTCRAEAIEARTGELEAYLKQMQQ